MIQELFSRINTAHRYINHKNARNHQYLTRNANPSRSRSTPWITLLYQSSQHRHMYLAIVQCIGKSLESDRNNWNSWRRFCCGRTKGVASLVSSLSTPSHYGHLMNTIRNKLGPVIDHPSRVSPTSVIRPRYVVNMIRDITLFADDPNMHACSINLIKLLDFIAISWADCHPPASQPTMPPRYL